MHCPQ